MVSVVAISMSVELFASIGLSETKARETLKNAVVPSLLQSIILKVRRAINALSENCCLRLFFSLVRLN